MNKQKPDDTPLESLMEMLSSEDGMVRRKARKALVALGHPAVSSLIHALQTSSHSQVR